MRLPVAVFVASLLLTAFVAYAVGITTVFLLLRHDHPDHVPRRDRRRMHRQARRILERNQP